MGVTLITTGIACIIAGIVGGGLKAFGIEVPALRSPTRQLTLAVFGCALIVVGWRSEDAVRGRDVALSNDVPTAPDVATSQVVESREQTRPEPPPAPPPRAEPVAQPRTQPATRRMVSTVNVTGVFGNETYQFDSDGNLASWSSALAASGVTCAGRAYGSDQPEFVWEIRMTCSISAFTVYVKPNGEVWQDVQNWLGTMQRSVVGHATFH